MNKFTLNFNNPELTVLFNNENKKKVKLIKITIKKHTINFILITIGMIFFIFYWFYLEGF